MITSLLCHQIDNIILKEGDGDVDGDGDSDGDSDGDGNGDGDGDGKDDGCKNNNDNKNNDNDYNFFLFFFFLFFFVSVLLSTKPRPGGGGGGEGLKHCILKKDFFIICNFTYTVRRLYVGHFSKYEIKVFFVRLICEINETPIIELYISWHYFMIRFSRRIYR